MKTILRRSFLLAFVAAFSVILGFKLGQPSSAPSGESASSQEATKVDPERPPLIGIASLTDENYIRAVREAGGIPVVLPSTGGSTECIADYLAALDGLLLPGGADIPPSEYGEDPHGTVRVLKEDRFLFEKSLSRAWIFESQKPILGICLGSQWINVASGGSLVQDIPSEFGVNHRGTTHAVTLEKDSRLGAILGASMLEVNSLHHQAVKTLGKGLRIVARCPDGVVEATESPDPDRFLIGVQWHPEKMLPEDKVQQKLMRAFIEEAKKFRNAR